MLRILPKFILWQVVTIMLLQLTEAFFVISKLNLFPLTNTGLARLKLINTADLSRSSQIKSSGFKAISIYATLELNLLP